MFIIKAFLEECKYAIKKKNVMNSINEKLNLDQSDESNSEFNKVFYGFNSIWPEYNVHYVYSTEWLENWLNK